MSQIVFFQLFRVFDPVNIACSVPLVLAVTRLSAKRSFPIDQNLGV